MSRKNLIKGVMPKQPCTVYKSPKKGQTSFRITASLLESILEKALKVGSRPELVISVPLNKDVNYVLTCSISKQRT